MIEATRSRHTRVRFMQWNVHAESIQRHVQRGMRRRFHGRQSACSWQKMHGCVYLVGAMQMLASRSGMNLSARHACP